MTIRERIAAYKAKPRRQFIPYEIQRLAETYRLGFARWERCPGCASSYLRAPNGPAYTKPCPACGRALDDINAIGIDQAVAIIAENRKGQHATLHT